MFWYYATVYKAKTSGLQQVTELKLKHLQCDKLLLDWSAPQGSVFGGTIALLLSGSVERAASER